MSAQLHCVTCSKSSGIMTCNGCERTFCVKHVLEHRQELNNQLDEITQEHDLVRQELSRSFDEHLLLQKINRWEKESITKIQVAAEVARADLRVIIDRSKNQLSKACHDIAINLRSSRETEDFSENELKRWIQQLAEIKLEIQSPSSIQLVEDERSIIHLMTIRAKNSINQSFVSHKSDYASNQLSPSFAQEKFSKTLGLATLNEQRLVVTCSGFKSGGASVLGQQLYSQGRQTVRFKIEKIKIPYNIFFGCISSSVIDSKIHFTSPSVVGWFGYDEVWQHGSANRESTEHGYESDEIATNDVLHLVFDCEQKQLELYHERTSKRHVLAINIDKTPFPWQLLLVLKNTNDCVKILS